MKKIGNNNTFVGNHLPESLSAGNGNTIVTLADASGNTILDKQMAIGLNAQAGPNSIAIGAGAGARTGIFGNIQINPTLSLFSF